MNKTPIILIVDDEPQNQKVLASTLKKGDYRLILADNGQQALDLLKTKKPDLILLDIMMPGIDGFEVCEKIKQNVATKDIPVIFLTAHTETEKVVKGFQLGAVDYITKPFKSEELITRVKTHLKLKATEEELKESNAAKDKFFSIIAHDLGNLFSGLFGLSRLLADHEVPKDKIENFLKMIHDNSKNGLDLLQNLLEWSRMQTGRIKVQPCSLNLPFLVEHNINLLVNHATQKNIKMVSYVDKLSVLGDEQMLNTVIRNLLSNAIKFTPKNGVIEVSSKVENKLVEISIKDTGVGIKPEDIDKLFRIDVNHSTIGTAEEKGTGLGLILCKEFVEANGGSIWVESELGKGSIFHIRLPRFVS